MIFGETTVSGVYVLDIEPQEDERGFFARTYCEREFAAHGLPARMPQASVSYTARRGTLRGLHYAAPPAREAKLVRCTAGASFHVALDLRPGSPSFLRHAAVELLASTRRALFVPAGCAHGVQTLEDRTELFYQMSEFFAPELARGVRWDDPAFGIVWPPAERIILERDRRYPDFDPAQVAGFADYV
ncbi:MAG TPA: dTDP-4-dehydrorhamnose 3,5-epimerase family protein [Acidiferrobacterales bacterium]